MCGRSPSGGRRVVAEEQRGRADMAEEGGKIIVIIGPLEHYLSIAREVCAGVRICKETLVSTARRMPSRVSRREMARPPRLLRL